MVEDTNLRGKISQTLQNLRNSTKNIVIKELIQISRGKWCNVSREGRIDGKNLRSVFISNHSHLNQITDTKFR